MATVATDAALDFTNVKDGGSNFNKRRQPEGDYRAKITGVVDAPSKRDGIMQWCFTIEVGTGTYPYYCKHEENQLWKIRNLLVACGKNVPKKRVKVNPNSIVGRTLAVTLEDDVYQGKEQSNIAATFPVNELDDDDVSDETDDDDEETPAPATKKKVAAPVEDDDDDDEDDTPPPPKKKKVVAPVVEDDDDDDDDAPPPPKKKTAKVAVVDDDDDLEEIEID